MDLIRLRRKSASQLGLFTRTQAADCGASARQIRGRIASGEWKKVLGRVLASADLPLTPNVMCRAASLAVPGGVLAGPCAARIWGESIPDRRIYLAIGRERHVNLSGVRFLRFAVDRRDVTRWEGAFITTRRRSVLDSLLLLPERPAQELLDRALNSGSVVLDDLVVFARASYGRRGLPQLRRLIHRVSGGSRFEAERLAASLLLDAGITGWKANLPLYAGKVMIAVGDIVFQAARLVVEIDGWAYHVTPTQFQTDRHRQNRLVEAGWTVVRFTWLDLTERPDYVIATIRTLLNRDASPLR